MQFDSPNLFLETSLWNRELINICWPSRLRWRSNRNLLTVACNSSILVKRFQYIGIFYCFSNFGTILIIIIIIILFFSGQAIGNANLRNRTTFSHQTALIHGPLSDGVHKTILVSIHITVLDLEPNLDFQTFLIISKTDHRIFNCNTSKRRFGQELPFIFFELRAPTCLWGRYDPKTENFTLFYIYLLHIHSFSKTFYILV